MNDRSWNIKAKMWNVFAKLEVIDEWMPYMDETSDFEWLRIMEADGNKS